MATNNAQKTFNTRVQQKHDFEINWLKATNFFPLPGEVIIYDAETEGVEVQIKKEDGTYIRNFYITKPRIKIGDGVTNVNLLPFISMAAYDDDTGNVTIA